MKRSKILIVEDDSLVAYDMQQTLINLGYHVIDIVSTFDEVKKTLHKVIPDIVLMDINLDNKNYNGIDIARYLLEEYNINVIFLTAYNNDKTIKEAASLNPHGYILKPFEEDNLITTLKLAFFKQTTGIVTKTDENFIVLGKEYYFDLDLDELFCGDVKIVLGKNEKALLKLLLKNIDETVTYKQIENTVYQGELMSSSTIRTLVYRLRTKLKHQFIESISSIGCKLVVLEN